MSDHQESPEEAELRRELTAERVRSRTYAEEIKQLKNEIVKFQSLVEQEDEARVNKLSKNLEQIKKEKQDLLLQVEQEEDYITNSLSRRLEQLRKEKIDLENQLEQEEEFITNKLQKQVQTVLAEKKNLEKRLEVELHEHEKLVKSEKEVGELRKKLQQYEDEQKEYQEKNESFKAELLKLKTENFVLGQRIKREQEKLSRVNSEKLKLMSNLEMGDEKIYNTKGRHLGLNLRARSVSLPPRADASITQQPPMSPLRPVSTSSSPVPSASPTASPSPIHPHSLSLPTTPVIAHVHPSHISPRNSPRGRSLSPMRRGKILKESATRIKGSHNENQQGWAALRDIGASSVLQIWQNGQIYGPPDVILDIDALHPSTSTVEPDKVDPRCITISQVSNPNKPAGDQQSHLPLTLVFETEESAAEWVAILNDLRS